MSDVRSIKAVLLLLVLWMYGKEKEKWMIVIIEVRNWRIC